MKSPLQNLALLGAGVIVFLVGAELFLRVFPQYMSEEALLRLHWLELGRQGAEQAMTVPDPYLGFLYKPGFSGRLSRGNLDFTFNTDEHGFRNPSPWPEQTDIVLVGDSMAFGYGVEDEEAWSRLVEKELPDIEIVNLGLIGAAPQQYFRLLKAFGLDLKPKLVLFMLFPGNDLIDAAAFEAWTEAGTERSYEEWRMLGDEPRELDMLRRLLERSYFATFLRGVRKMLRSSVEGRTIEFEDGSRVRLAPTILESSLAMAQPGHPVFELVMDTIEAARAISRESGSHFLVLLTPTKETVYLPAIGEPPPPLVATFASALEKRGIDYLDLTPHFQAHAEDTPPVFYEVDGHPNVDGQRLIARVVADHLERSRAAYGLGAGRADRRAAP